MYCAISYNWAVDLCHTEHCPDHCDDSPQLYPRIILVRTSAETKHKDHVPGESLALPSSPLLREWRWGSCFLVDGLYQ